MTQYNLAAILNLLVEGYPADQLEDFAFRYYEAVYRDFADGQTNSQRIRAIVDYAASRGEAEIERLLKVVEEDNPGKFREFEGRLRLVARDGAPLAVSIPLPGVPMVPQFVGRQTELESYRARLEERQVVIFTGLHGIGKTWMGARLARETASSQGIPAGEENIFWFTFDESVNNTSEALLRALAAFLFRHGAEEPWRYVNQELETQRSLDLNFQLSAIYQALKQGSYIICLDEFEVVKDDPGLLFFFDFVRRKSQAAGGGLPAKFILMGSEIPAEMEYLAPDALQGFSLDDARIFLAAKGLELAEDLVRRLWELTEGSPMLLQLSASALRETRGNPADRDALLERMAEVGDVRDYLMNNILSCLLPADEEVLEALSIFAAPVKWRAAVEILSAAGLREVHDRIYTLVRRGFIIESPGEMLRLHGLVRDYCYRVLEPDARQRLHRAAAVYYEAQQNNLLAGYHQLERGAAGEALELLTHNVRRIVHAGDGSVLLKLLSRFQWPQMNAAQKAALCQARGDVYRTHGKYRQALDEYKVARDYAQSRIDQSRVLYSIGLAYSMAGNYGEAVKNYRKSLRLYVAGDDPLYEANIEVALAWALYRQGHRSAARRQFKLSREAGLRLGDDILAARAGMGLGALAWARGSLDEAQDFFERSQSIFAEYHDRIGEVGALNNLGMVYSTRGDLAKELDQYQRAMEIARQVGDVQTLRVIYNNLGNLYHMLNNLPEAAFYYQQLAQLASDTGHKPMLSTAYVGLADVYLAMGHLDEAVDSGEAAMRAAVETGEDVDLAISSRVMGDIWLAQGDLDQAKTCFETSVPQLEAAEEPEELEKARRGLALVLDGLANRQKVDNQSPKSG